MPNKDWTVLIQWADESLETYLAHVQAETPKGAAAEARAKLCRETGLRPADALDNPVSFIGAGHLEDFSGFADDRSYAWLASGAAESELVQLLKQDPPRCRTCKGPIDVTDDRASSQQQCFQCEIDTDPRYTEGVNHPTGCF